MYYKVLFYIYSSKKMLCYIFILVSRNNLKKMYIKEVIESITSNRIELRKRKYMTYTN